MTEGPTTRHSRWSAALDGMTAGLLSLSLGLIVGGFVWPGGDAPPEKEKPPAFTDLAASAPNRLLIPAIKINLPIIPIQNDANRVLQIPESPKTVGWWDVSAKPGATKGQTLLTGHALRDGSGPLNRLTRLRKGKPVDVITKKGRMRYRVTRVREWGYETVAKKAEELFGQDVATGRLVLVSCTDWDGQKWNKNVIVFGRPLGEPRKAKRKRERRQAERADDAGREAAPAS